MVSVAGTITGVPIVLGYDSPAGLQPYTFSASASSTASPSTLTLTASPPGETQGSAHVVLYVPSPTGTFVQGASVSGTIQLDITGTDDGLVFQGESFTLSITSASLVSGAAGMVGSLYAAHGTLEATVPEVECNPDCPTQAGASVTLNLSF
jgi:hypothetical protein